MASQRAAPARVRLSQAKPPVGLISLCIDLAPDVTAYWVYEADSGKEDRAAECFAASLELSLEALRRRQLVAPSGLTDESPCVWTWGEYGETVRMHAACRAGETMAHLAEATPLAVCVPVVRLASLLAEATTLVRTLIQPPAVQLHAGKPPESKSFGPEDGCAGGLTVTVEVEREDDSEGEEGEVKRNVGDSPRWSLVFSRLAGGPSPAELRFVVENPTQCLHLHWHRLLVDNYEALTFHRLEGSIQLAAFGDTFRFEACGFLVTVPHHHVAPQLAKALAYAVEAGLMPT